MRPALLAASLLMTGAALAGPDQRTTVGDGGLGDLLGMIESEQSSQPSCRQSGLVQELAAQERALESVDGMGCKAITSRLGDLDSLSRRAGECRDDALQTRADRLGAQYRAAENQRCQASGLDTAGQIAGIAELGLTQMQQRADEKAARQQALLQQQRLAEQARQEALARQREIAARAVTTTSVNPYGNNTTTSSGGTTSSSAGNTGSGISAPLPPGTSASTGNRRPGYIYDDMNHNQCLSIQAIGQNTGRAMAYGHYQMTNRCNYPITTKTCTVSDNADGSPSDTWNRFQDGAPCPGGWDGASFKAGETQKSRTWFEFRNIRFHAYICREGWSILNTQDKPPYLIGERSRCRIYR